MDSVRKRIKVMLSRQKYWMVCAFVNDVCPVGICGHGVPHLSLRRGHAHLKCPFSRHRVGCRRLSKLEKVLKEF